MDLTCNNIRFVPCVHQRVTFAEQVRREAHRWRPDRIAVELPATLKEWIVRGVMRLPGVSAICWEETEQPGCLCYLPIDPCDGLIEAVRLGCAHQIPLEFIDLDLPGLSEPYRYMPDDMIVDKVGLEAYVSRLAPLVRASWDDPTTRTREHMMARHLAKLSAGGERILCVLGLAHFANVHQLLVHATELFRDTPEPAGLVHRPGVFLSHVHGDSLGAVLGEIPYLTYLYEQQREEQELTGQVGFDKLDAIHTILKTAEQSYQRTYRDTISLMQWKTLLQYTRNLALVKGRLRPDLYDTIIAARGIIDGDYGYEVYELARSYPPQSEQHEELPILRVADGHASVEGRTAPYEQLNPRYEPPPSETVRVGFRRRPSPKMQELWKRQWDASVHFGLCSWPPEDQVQERFMHFIRKRALQVVTEDRKQVQEFRTSMLDGLDVRETMRNWHTGKLYVQSTPAPQGTCGAVVCIFRDEPLEERETSWRTTLYAEHQNESDIAFFATPLGRTVVGPRISRTEFGGILSIYPPKGLPDIWSFRFGGQIQMCSDVLLTAAVLFSTDRYIAFVHDRPPRVPLRQFAEANHKHIIYIPRHSFAAAHLKKIRRFHILDGHDVRAWARDYIFED